MENIVSAQAAVQRVNALNWQRISQDLDDQGNAILERVLCPDECQILAGLYPDDRLFRSRVVMARHGFGRGEYKYFSYPLPDIISELRTVFYSQVAPVANRWNTALGVEVRFPEKHSDFLQRIRRRRLQLPPPGSLRRARLSDTGDHLVVRARKRFYWRGVCTRGTTSPHAVTSGGGCFASRRCCSLRRPLPPSTGEAGSPSGQSSARRQSSALGTPPYTWHHSP